MGFLSSIFTVRSLICMKKHSSIITLNVTISIIALYLWNAEFKYLTLASSIFCLGGTYLYSCNLARDKLSRKHAIVITGCDSGLGYSLALHCHQLGATVIAGALEPDGQGAKILQDESIFVHSLDITEKKSVEQFAEYVRTLLKEKNLVLRCLVNNAGVLIFGEFEWQTEDQIRRQVEVNLLGTMRITRELMPLIRADFSRIIVISSHCTTEPLPGVAAYGATKAAIASWATAIRVELKKYGVKVVCFVPGSFIKESNIFSLQNEHFETMWTSMSEEAKEFYDDYFQRYAEYFKPLLQKIGPRKIKNPLIYEMFEGSLLDKHPFAVYTSEPLKYFFIHTITKITPSYIRDILIERFVSLPSRKEAQ